MDNGLRVHVIDVITAANHVRHSLPPDQTISPTAPSVFLSHSSKDKFFARKLAESLRTYGVRVWIDEAELRIGDSLAERIGKAISKTDYFAVLLSPNSVNSAWVQKELALAMTRELAESKVSVLPIIIERCVMPDFLKDKLYADFSEPDQFEDALATVLKALGVQSAVKRLSPAATTPTRQAFSHAASQKPLLEEFEDIDIIRIDESKTRQDQVHQSMYYVYLELSEHPRQEWVQIFDAERRFPRHTMWRRAVVDGKNIVILCPPEELENYHITDLKEDVSNSNTKYREYLRNESEKNARDKGQAERVKTVLRHAATKLK